MSISSINAQAFYAEVASTRTVWSIRDQNGIPAPRNSDGVRTMPFWSSENRATSLIDRSPEYSGFDLFSLDWDTFRDRWVPGLTKDGILVGLNWTGESATGYDLQPSEVQAIVQAAIERLPE